ncbi:MAG: hypothetical protein DRP47_08800, partial [Candidatus Zixiibacteriota bacterium]
YVSYYLDKHLWLYDIAADSSWQSAKFHGTKYEWLNDSQVVFADKNLVGWGDTSYHRVELAYTTIGNSDKSIGFDSTKEVIIREIWGPRLVSDNVGTVVLLMGDTTFPISVNWEHQESRASLAFRAISHYPVLYSHGKPYFEDTDIWLIGIHGEKLRRVTLNKKYKLPVLSPNGFLITASDVGGNTVIMDTNGVELASLYHADWEFWSPNSDAIYFVRIVQGDGDIIGGDLYSYLLDSKELIQLTTTPDIVEMKPCVSPDGTMLAYRTYHREPEGIEILLLPEGGSK